MHRGEGEGWRGVGCTDRLRAHTQANHVFDSTVQAQKTTENNSNTQQCTNLVKSGVFLHELCCQQWLEGTHPPTQRKQTASVSGSASATLPWRDAGVTAGVTGHTRTSNVYPASKLTSSGTAVETLKQA